MTKDERDIDEIATELINTGVDLEKENVAAGFINIRMKRNVYGLLELKQTDLIDHVL